jgi:uncharacterized membrane protein
LADIESTESEIGKEEVQRALYETFGISKERLLGFADAIFSIAITLLVISLALPFIQDSGFDNQFIDALVSLIGRITGFVISFFVIATYWLSLHRMFFFVRRLDKRFIWLTLVFLFFIVFMPFPTSVLGLYGNHSQAAIFYAITISLSSFILFAMWRYAIKDRRLVDQDLEESTIRLISQRSLISGMIFLISIPIALLSPALAELMWLLMLFGLTTLRDQKRGSKSSKG